MTELAGIRDIYGDRLHRLGIDTIRDLLLHYPRRHKDFSNVTPISLIQPGAETTVRAKIVRIGAHWTRVRHMRLTEAVLSDDSGKPLTIIWFNQSYVARNLHPGQEIFVAGKVELDRGSLVLKNPEYEVASDDPQHAARLVPIYPETAGMTSRFLRAKLRSVIHLADALEEFIPEEIRRRRNLLPRPEAVREIHYPHTQTSLSAARERLAFEEMFVLQVAAQQAKRARQQELAPSVRFDEAAARAFVAALPFKLTNAQRVAAWQILKDLEKTVPMNRLLEGDVGSGKTVVATMAIHHTARAGFQSVLLAPTEILARQHAEVVETLLRPFGVSVGLLLGSTAPAQRAAILTELLEGSLGVVIGTHALIEDDVRFKRLGFVVVDEQHRFGVSQRLALRKKSDQAPHFLSMTATPIPRTLGLTLYGDLDISVIDEMPPGRRPVVTRLVPPERRDSAYTFVREQVTQGRQVFVLCPLIQESDKLGVRSATQELEKLQGEVFPDLASRIALLHGRLKPAEKEEVMGRFQRGEIGILVTTSVVEVGIDIANATVMMVEGADRFGLAQLHQFRGRVGRGAHQSYCLLFTDQDDAPTIERLQAVVDHQSGFELSEIDLRLRGMGELYGLRQHGMPDFKVASLLDAILIKEAQGEAGTLLDGDPTLRGEPGLRRQVSAYRQVFALD